MSKSGRHLSEEEIKEKVRERLPEWRRELLRMWEKAPDGDEARDKSRGRGEKG